MTPPKTLDDRAATIWRRTARAVSSDHFAESDAVLLAEYCRAAALADQAAEALTKEGIIVDGKTNPWIVVQEKTVRNIVALCARLRLSPQARFDRLKAGTTSRDQNTWLDDDPDDLIAKPQYGPASFRVRR
jgi:P27 family predicted phage terminase small subunit